MKDKNFWKWLGIVFCGMLGLSLLFNFFTFLIVSVANYNEGIDLLGGVLSLAFLLAGLSLIYISKNKLYYDN